MRRWGRSEGGGEARASAKFTSRWTDLKRASTGASIANHSRDVRSGARTSLSPANGGSALSVSPQGASEPWSRGSECGDSEWCGGRAEGGDCVALSACPPKTAAVTSQHGNKAVLSQNTTQAKINPARANLRRPRGLAGALPPRLRVEVNMPIKISAYSYRLLTHVKSGSYCF